MKIHSLSQRSKKNQSSSSQEIIQKEIIQVDEVVHLEIKKKSILMTQP